MSRDADEVGQGARRHQRGEILGRAAFERGRAHRHAIGVGGGHRQHAAREFDKDARQDRAGVVARGGAQDALRRLEEGLAVDPEGASVVDLRKPREVIGVVGVEGVLARAALQLEQARTISRGEHDLLRRQVADDVEQQPPRHDHAPRLVHVGEQLRPDGQLHVGGGELDRLLGGRRVDQHPRQDLDTRTLRHAPGHDLEVSEKVVLGAGDAHGARSLDGTAAHTATRPGRAAQAVSSS